MSNDTVTVVGAVSVGVETEVYAGATREEMREALRDELKGTHEHVLDAEVGEVEG